jgi:hypothetical protein
MINVSTWDKGLCLGVLSTIVSTQLLQKSRLMVLGLLLQRIMERAILLVMDLAHSLQSSTLPLSLFNRGANWQSHMSTKSSRKGKHHITNGPHTGVASSSTASSSARDERAYEETRDAFILGFNIIREVAEATELLSPLKSTCLLLVRGLETTRVRVPLEQYAWIDCSIEHR